MGSRFLTKREAAQVLGCHVRTIFHKIEKGELRPVPHGHLVGVMEEDVIALRDSKLKRSEERELPFAVNRQTLLRHDTELKLLRHEMNQVLRVLNIRREPLTLSDMEAVSLYKAATEYGTKGWPPQIEETWCEYFLRLQVNHLQQIQRIVEDDHPWRPFMKLVKTMLLKPYNTELLIQLSAGRDNVQMMATVWFEINQFSLRSLDMMLTKETKPNERLVGIIERRQKKYAAKE